MRELTRRQELLSQARRQPEAVVDQLLAAEQQIEALRVKVAGWRIAWPSTAPTAASLPLATD